VTPTITGDHVFKVSSRGDVRLFVDNMQIPILVQAWVSQVPALLHAWFPGQYGGKALAEILFGEKNPSVPTTTATMPSIDVNDHRNLCRRLIQRAVEITSLSWLSAETAIIGGV
jgi:hypothetical protein